ncbi:MAG: hypothetical protein HY962_13855 [Ignavibacteriae bacterium]|nr:hypothetical protein [Ignavibacteriota bacterium]
MQTERFSSSFHAAAGRSVLVAVLYGLLSVMQSFAVASEVDEGPSARRRYIGVILSYDVAISAGSFSTACDCGYGEGSGAGPTAGLQFDMAINEQFRFAVAGLYRRLDATYETAETRITYIADLGMYRPIDFARRVELSYSWFGVLASAEWRPWQAPLHFAAGLSLGYLGGDHLLETERIQTAGIGYPETGTTDRTYHDGAIDALTDADGSKVLPVRRLQVGLEAAVGYDIRIGTDTYLAPRVSLSYPLTSLSTNAPSWSQPRVGFGLLIRFGL